MGKSWSCHFPTNSEETYLGAWVAICACSQAPSPHLSSALLFLFLTQMYWIHPTSEEQIRQRLPAGDEGEDPLTGGTPEHGDHETVPPGCSAGKVMCMLYF